LSALDICSPEEVQCVASPKRNGGGFLIGHIGWFRGQRPVFRQANVLSMRTKPQTRTTKYLVALMKSLYVFAD
jgi:hypothetical protein